MQINKNKISKAEKKEACLITAYCHGSTLTLEYKCKVLVYVHMQNPKSQRWSPSTACTWLPEV